MTEQTRSALREMQALDLELARTRDAAGAFEPRIREVEEPALELEGLVERTRGRIREMRMDERRLELAVNEKRAREEKLKDRLNQVRNVREEAAVNAELEMVQRALEAEETEALGLLDQIRRLELELEEQTDLLEQARDEVGPRRAALVAERDGLLEKVDELLSARHRAAELVDPEELRVYEAIRGDRGRAALAALTEDGACGNCFSMIPLQFQQEIVRGESIYRCEGCGVILSAPVPEEEEPADDEEVDAPTPDDGAQGDETPDTVGEADEAPEPVAEAEVAPEPAAEADEAPEPVAEADEVPEPVDAAENDAEEGAEEEEEEEEEEDPKA